MALKEGTNEAIIEGILAEKIVRELDNGAIAGELVIQAEIEVDGEQMVSLIPVSFYTTPLTKAGKPNVAYKGIKTILDSANSLAEVAGDTAQADCIRIRNGQINENMFFAQDRLVSFARIRGNFFDRVKASDCVPKAQFKVKMVVGDMFPEERTEGGDTFETGRLVVLGNIVQYNGTVDEIRFIVQNKKHIDIIQKNWNIGDTVNALGVIKYVTREVVAKESEEDSFGEPMITTFTRREREFIITGGSGSAVDGWDEDEIARARRDRKNRINELKDKQSNREATSDKPKSGVKDW